MRDEATGTGAAFEGVLPADRILAGDAHDDYSHDEALGATPRVPARGAAAGDDRRGRRDPAGLRRAPHPGDRARGSGTGLSGAAIPVEGGVVVSFERMKRIEIDEENQVAVVEPGVTLAELDEVTAKHSLTYPVFPGEYSASLGGNVATNAGGMRAVKYGVTRHQVLGLEAVLPSGEVITHRWQVREGLDRLRPHPADRRARRARSRSSPRRRCGCTRARRTTRRCSPRSARSRR